MAKRLQKDGLRVWRDKWETPVAASRQSAAFSPEGQEPEDLGALPSHRYAEKIEAGLRRSRFEFQPSAFILQPFLDEEIGVALCLGQMPDDPWLIRAAAQLLSSPRVEPERLVRLAEMERVEPVLLHIAAACARVDAAMDPWAALRRRLHPRRTVRTEALPHWTRFAILPGLTRDGYAPPQWLTRRE
jgi:hypothetical protein